MARGERNSGKGERNTKSKSMDFDIIDKKWKI
jgi:hypothetical protein